MEKNYIVENSAICRECGDKIISKNRHDFVSCSCGKISVDGGQDYLRRLGDFNDFEDTSICMDEEAVMKSRDAVDWGKETGRNSLGIALAVIRSLRDSGHLKV